MTIKSDNPELATLLAKCASLESRLKEETSAHARTRELLQDRLAQTENIAPDEKRADTVDGSEREEASLRAREAETLLKEAIGAIPDGFVIFDADQRFVQCNDTYRKMYIEIADLLVPGTPRGDLSVAFTRSRGANTFSKRRAEALARSGADFFSEHHEHQRRDGRWIRSVDRRLPNGSVVGIRTDITTLKRREEAIRESQETLSGFMESATDRFVIFDGDLNYVDANRTMVEANGIPKAELVGKNMSVLAPESKASGRYDRYIEVIQTGEPYRFDFAEISPADGQTTFLTATAFKLADGIGIAAQDVTERKRAENSLRQSEHRFRDFSESASDGLWEMDADLRYTNVWGAILEGVREKGREPIGKTRWEHIGVDPSKDEHWRKHKEDLEARRPYRNFEYSYENAFGRHHRRASGKPIFGADGSFVGYRGVVENRTAEVEAEWKARQVQERLEHAIRSMPEGITLFDAEDRLVVRNNAARDCGAITGEVEPGARFEDLCRTAVAEGLLPQALGREEDFIQERIARHRAPSGPFEQLIGDRRLETREHKLPDGSTLISQVDVTEKRAAEQRIKESERRLLESQRIAKIGTIEHDLITGEVVWTDEAFRLYGFEPGEVVPSFDAYLERLHPDDFDDAVQAKTELDRGEQTADAVRRVVWSDGSVHALDTVVNLERDPSGKPMRLIRTIQDITHRVQAEDALRQSRNDLAEAQRITHIGSWHWNLETDEVTWSDEHWAILGLEPGDVSTIDPKLFYSFVHPDDLKLVQDTGQGESETGTGHVLDFRIIRRDGKTRHVHTRSRQYVSDGVRLIVGTMQDVTARIRADEELRRSKNDLTSAQRLAHVGSWRWNTGTDEVVWSDEHWAIFGLEPGEVSWIDPAFFDPFGANWIAPTMVSTSSGPFRTSRRYGGSRER